MYPFHMQNMKASTNGTTGVGLPPLIRNGNMKALETYIMDQATAILPKINAYTCNCCYAKQKEHTVIQMF